MEDVIKNLKDHISSLQAEIAGWKQMHADRKAECVELQKELEQAKSFAPEVWGRMEEQVKLLKENSKTIDALTEEVEKWSSRTNDLVNGDMVGMIVRNKELEKNVLQLATLLSKPQIKFFLKKEETEGIMEILKKISE